MATAQRGGKKGRKVGRNKKKPCQQRYVSSNRKDKNKIRKAQTHANKTGQDVKIKIGEKIEVIKPERA